MKKKKFLKFIAMAMLSCFFLITVSSCGSNSGLDGGICGEATADGDNVFSNIRRYYCEKWTQNYFYYSNIVSESIDNKGNVDKYGQYAVEYSKKFIINETNTELVNVEVGTDDYNNAHYIFTYYTEDNKILVESYINNNVDNPSTYLELIEKSANDSSKGYFPKVANTGNDDSGYTIDGTKYTTVKEYLTNHSKACLVFTDNFVDPQTGVTINKLSWKGAFEEGGFLTGIFTYPMAWFVNLFVTWFGGYGNGTGAGWGQIGAILLTTIILKLAVFLLTFKSQSSTQKMQDIQPEILKIQAKYGQNPSAEDKQRMSMELMGVYQKYGIKPLAPFASLLITFPVFIAMYRAVTYLAVLRTGEVGGVVLGNLLNSYIIGGNFKFTALIIFILMAASQIMSMKLPQILNRKRMSREAKQQQKQTNMMSNVMMIMILVMGFFMPVIMSIYWIASALVSVGQSLIMHKLNNGNKKGKYKVKKVENGPTKIPQGYKSN